jgi:hypothetical protein
MTNYTPHQLEVDEIVEAAQELAKDAGFTYSRLVWTGDLIRIQGRLWVKITDATEYEFKASDQWISNDGHMVMEAEDIFLNEEDWLL